MKERMEIKLTPEQEIEANTVFLNMPHYEREYCRELVALRALAVAVEEYLEWGQNGGCYTSSDRQMFDRDFAAALKAAGREE